MGRNTYLTFSLDDVDFVDLEYRAAIPHEDIDDGGEAHIKNLNFIQLHCRKTLDYLPTWNALCMILSSARLIQEGLKSAGCKLLIGTVTQSCSAALSRCHNLTKARASSRTALGRIIRFCSAQIVAMMHETPERNSIMIHKPADAKRDKHRRRVAEAVCSFMPTWIFTVELLQKKFMLS